MAKFKFKKGNWIVAHIRDHAKNYNGNIPLEFYVVGRVHEFNEIQITLDSWAWTSPTRERTPSDDIECFTLVRNAIVRFVVLCEGDPFDEEIE